MATPSNSTTATLEAIVNESENHALLEAAEKFSEGQRVALDESASVLVLPTHRRVESLKKFFDEYRERPERKKGTAQLTTVQSFIDHVNRHKDPASAVFANDSRQEPSLLAVLDYQEAGPDGMPRFGQHRANYAFPLSDEWKAWMEASKGPLNQAQLAEFLEDHIRDVLDPGQAGEAAQDFAAELEIKLASPKALITLSKGLQVKVGQNVKTFQNLASGECSLVFEETHEAADGAAVRVPGGFVIGIPVFRGGDVYSVPVRLRYRLSGRSVTWQFMPHRADLVFDHAFGEAAEKVKAGTELPMFFGKPEAG